MQDKRRCKMRCPCLASSRVPSTWAGMGDHKDTSGTAWTSLDRPIGTRPSGEAAEMDRALQDLSQFDGAIVEMRTK